MHALRASLACSLPAMHDKAGSPMSSLRSRLRASQLKQLPRCSADTRTLRSMLLHLPDHRSHSTSFPFTPLGEPMSTLAWDDAFHQLWIHAIQHRGLVVATSPGQMPDGVPQGWPRTRGSDVLA